MPSWRRAVAAGLVCVPLGQQQAGVQFPGRDQLPLVLRQALRVATHLQCMLEGHTTLEGTPAEVTRDQVEAAYFGVTDGSNP